MRPASLDRGDSGEPISAEMRNDLALSFGLATAFGFRTGLVTGLVNGLVNSVDVGLGVAAALGLYGPIRCCDDRGLMCPDKLDDNLSVLSLSVCVIGSLGLAGLETARCLASGLDGASAGDHGRMAFSLSS